MSWKIFTKFCGALALASFVGACGTDTQEGDLATNEAAAKVAPATGNGSCTATVINDCDYFTDYNNTTAPRAPQTCVEIKATGLPVSDGACDSELINFLYTDNAGNHGFVLGCSDGTWTVRVGAPNGPTSYAFASRIGGGGRYTTYATCSL
jgi:hypothetical protein